jgi:hypothetical protein
MSHSNAEFRLEDGTVYYGEYDGASDVMLTNMFNTFDEAQQHWRKQVRRKCTCEEPVIVDCIAWTSYGFEHEWEAECCTKCKTFLGPFSEAEADANRIYHQEY